jgi:hypothetical protein
MGLCLPFLRRVGAATLTVVLLVSAVPADALEGNPRGPKEKERHVFRDVQLGLSHPSTHGKSTQTSKPPPSAFPWFLPFPSFAPTSGGQGGAVAK